MFASPQPTFLKNDRGTAYAATTFYGPAVTPGTASKGAWTTIGATSVLANDVYGIEVYILNGSTIAVARPTALDIGVDAAGGTAFTPIIQDILCGMSSVTGNGLGFRYFFPFFIKKGSSVGARAWSATASTLNVHVSFVQGPSNYSWAGSYAQTIGMTAGTVGTTIVPVLNSYSSWQSIGTTTYDAQYWQLCIQPNNANLAQNVMCFDLAYGNGATFQPIITQHQFHVTNTAAMTGCLLNPPEECFHEVPAGSTLYVRGRCNVTPETGFNAVAIGIGG